MLSRVRELERVLPALRAARPVRDREIDWSAYAEALGTDVPRDFKELSEAYPTIEIDGFLLVNTVTPGEEAESAAVAIGAADALESLAEDDMAHRYVPYPQPGGCSAVRIRVPVTLSTGARAVRNRMPGRWS
ncbi:hypothetical protein ACL02U_00325 [Streptomyces sp. MS06]|uniref:hypothetical protein n=1 Tax=Streptomyces sp. MS06 TaxID=3385974 RepID=UPI00399FA333